MSFKIQHQISQEGQIAVFVDSSNFCGCLATATQIFKMAPPTQTHAAGKRGVAVPELGGGGLEAGHLLVHLAQPQGLVLGDLLHGLVVVLQRGQACQQLLPLRFNLQHAVPHQIFFTFRLFQCKTDHTSPKPKIWRHELVLLAIFRQSSGAV